MHFGFQINQILWTLTFASLLVLEVVLMGRDRARRFPLFGVWIGLITLRLLSSRLLYGRMEPLRLNFIFLGLAVLITLVSFAMLAELAYRCFGQVSRKQALAGTLGCLVVAGGVLVAWGPWPAWKTLVGQSTVSLLNLLQLVSQRGDMLNQMLAVLLGVLVVAFGCHVGLGWRKHALQVTLGYSVYSLAQVGVRAVWQYIASHARPASEAEYNHLLDLREWIFNGSSILFVLILIFWVAMLWRDEPGAESAVEPVAIPAGVVAELPAVSTPSADPTETTPEENSPQQ